MQTLQNVFHFFLFFSLGALIALLLILTSAYLVFSVRFRDRVYPGVKTASVNLSGQDPKILKETLFSDRQFLLDGLTFEFSSGSAQIKFTGKEIGLGFDTELMAKRAFSIGRQTQNPYHNFAQILSSLRGQIDLPLEVKLNDKLLDQKILEIAPLVEENPIDAIYEFSPLVGPDKKGRVKTFKASKNGLVINREAIKEIVRIEAATVVSQDFSGRKSFSLPLPTTTIFPNVQTSTADQLGIKSLLGRGESYFYDSIPNRVYNIELGTQMIGGSLVPPNEVFSFSQSIGTVSAIFGFKKAYAIKEGKTVLDDGGGVCQVATTLYRAILNSGLPIVERVAHSYRVGFYEQGGFRPGLDATVYPPSPDFKFKNDTGGWILIQSDFNPLISRLSFEIFGQDDGRKTQIDGPFILSTSPPPDPIYEDDPNLPAGVVNQVDTAHWGANVSFGRKVTRNGEIIINETVKSSYIPWPARFLRGTK